MSVPPFVKIDHLKVPKVMLQNDRNYVIKKLFFISMKSLLQEHFVPDLHSLFNVKLF